MNILDFPKMKQEGRRISMVTCYDHWTARRIARTEIDCVLVGDSVAMVMHGFASTVHATVEMMSLHTQAVARGLSSGAGAEAKFLVADLPFLSFRKGIEPALDAVDQLMKSGAHAVKLEGVWGHEAVVEQVVRSGVPVMGHIGLTPQSVFQLGGHRVQGRDAETADDLLKQARRLQELGCFSLVLECVPAELATQITRELSVPTIGIGAGAGTDGQVLVLQDLLGADRSFKPRFLKHFADAQGLIEGALGRFHQEVVAGVFPNEEEAYR